jgi:hypothetical protein
VQDSISMSLVSSITNSTMDTVRRKTLLYRSRVEYADFCVEQLSYLWMTISSDDLSRTRLPTMKELTRWSTFGEARKGCGGTFFVIEVTRIQNASEMDLTPFVPEWYVRDEGMMRKDLCAQGEVRTETAEQMRSLADMGGVIESACNLAKPRCSKQHIRVTKRLSRRLPHILLDEKTKQTRIGLGLCLAQQIISYHKGQLDIESERGKVIGFEKLNFLTDPTEIIKAIPVEVLVS